MWSVVTRLFRHPQGIRQALHVVRELKAFGWTSVGSYHRMSPLESIPNLKAKNNLLNQIFDLTHFW